MAQHGYLREYDEGWDRGEGRDRDRERSWRDDDRERGWRGGSESGQRDRGWQEDDPNQRNRNFMLGDRDRNLGRGGDRDHERGFFDRMGDEARSWFRDDDRQYRGTHHEDHEQRGTRYGREHGFGGSQGDYGRSGQSQRFSGGGDWERSPRNFSSHQDDHYRSWRDRQMSALDADYQDYCREREQQFHQDFDSWRKNRQGQGGQRQPQGSMSPSSSSSSQQQPQASAGQQQSKQGGSSSEVMELNNPTTLSTEPQSGSSPTGAATLGTNNSENSGPGRGRR